MAKYPISRRTMPGTSGGIRAGLDFRTGEAEVWEQIARLASTGVDVGQKYYLQQAEIQMQDSILQAENEIKLNLANRLRENQNEDTYQHELDKTLSAMNKFRPKNRMAGRGFDSWIKKQTPGWREDVEKSRQIRIDNKWNVTRDNLAAQSIENESLARLRIHMVTGVAFGRTSEADAVKFIREITHKTEISSAGKFASIDPEGLLRSAKNGTIEGYVTLSPTEVQTVKGMARRIIYNRNAEFEAVQEKVGRQMIVDFWNGQLTNPQDVTDALEINLITPSMAKYLRDAILSPKDYSAQKILIAETQVRNAIDRYQSAEITDIVTSKKLRQDAIESLYANADILGKTKGSSLLARIFDEKPDKALADMTREGKSLMEEYIRTRDPISGMFKDNKQEIMLTAEAQLLLDLEIEEAKKRKKPLGRRDIMIKAMEIGQSQRNKLDKMTKKQIPEVPYQLGTRQVFKPPPMGWSVGLESIWEELNADEQRTAMKALAQGKTPEEIIDYFNRSK